MTGKTDNVRTMHSIEPLLATFTILALLTAGCDKSPTSTATKTTESHASTEASEQGLQKAPPPIQPELFQRQVYKTLNGSLVLTLISKDECESTKGGVTVLAKYTKQDDRLRVVEQDSGTNVVNYFRVTAKGLVDGKGSVLLSAEAYAATIDRLERERQKQAEAPK
jgi:hypothetical protein